MARRNVTDYTEWVSRSRYLGGGGSGWFCYTQGTYGKNGAGWEGMKGAILTKRGVVGVLDEGGWTDLVFVNRGIVYIRTVRDKRSSGYSRRGLVTIARRFAEEVVKNRQ